ncbi:MAG TPA: hypothetical protein VGJ35_09370 [Burkholderiaceae bacterium]
MNIRLAGLIAVFACAIAATATQAGTDAASGGDAASAPRRGNVLTLRKTPSAASDHAPTVAGFVRLAAANNLEALFMSFDDVPVRVNGEAAIKHFLASEVMPFFADADRLDSQLRVTEATFEDGTTGHMAYSYVVTTSGQIKPFVIAWRGDSDKLRVMDVQLGRCVKARHPVTPGRCDS